MSDNGGSEKETYLTPEELLIKKREAFDKNPDDFFNFSEIIIGTRILVDGSIQCLIGHPKQLLLEASLGRIQYEVNKCLMILEQKARVEAEQKVVQSRHGIMDFVRRKNG